MSIQIDSGQRKLRTKSELANRYAVVPRTIDNWMAAGQIPFFKIGRKLVRFDASECDRALEQFKVKSIFETEILIEGGRK